MSSGFFIVFGTLAVGMLILSAHAATKEKNPWGFFAATAACSLVVVGGFAWLVHWIVSWMQETGLIVAFLIIGFVFLCFWLLIGALGAVADLVNHRD